MSVKDHRIQPGRIGYVVTASDSPDHYNLIRDCQFCGKEARVIVPAQGLWDWEHGVFIQIAMFGLSQAERETVMTGTHGECWAEMFGSEPDEGCPNCRSDQVAWDEETESVYCKNCGWRE